MNPGSVVIKGLEGGDFINEVQPQSRKASSKLFEMP
jgi:hypothetical protein